MKNHRALGNLLSAVHPMALKQNLLCHTLLTTHRRAYYFPWYLQCGMTYPISSSTLPEKPSPPVWPPCPFPAAPPCHSDGRTWFGGSWHLNSPVPFSLPYLRPPRLLESCLSSSTSERLRTSKQFHTYSHPSSTVCHCFCFSNGKFLRGTANRAGPQEAQPPEGTGLGVRLRLDPDCPAQLSNPQSGAYKMQVRTEPPSEYF